MGVVYLAHETPLDRYVAVKVLPPHLASQPTIRERFLREARTAAQLSHPNVVPIYRAEEVGGYAFFAMAYIDGDNLAERVRDRGPLPPSDVVRVLREAAWALAYAHARGVVHRDIKAPNIMIERGTGRAVVTDFGIARDGTSSLTEAGEVVGTVHYMSPEQANGEPLDGRSDLYSLGVAGFFALSGRLPFEGDNAAAVLLAVSSRPAPSLASVAPQLPRALIEVIDRCLRANPADRYATGEALAEALGQALEKATAGVVATTPDRIIPAEHAEAIWLRAAQLQADAASRLEQRSRQGSGLTAVSMALPSGGYRLRDVEAAAAEVGISPEFVALALAERPTQAAAAMADATVRGERITTRLLGTTERSISVTRVIRGSPRAVLEAMGRVCPARPYLMSLRDTVGGHPLDGGVMVFSVPKMMMNVAAGSAELYTPFTYRMYQLELFQLNATLRPLAAGGGCEVTFYGDLRSGLRKNLTADKWDCRDDGGRRWRGGYRRGDGRVGSWRPGGAARRRRRSGDGRCRASVVPVAVSRGPAKGNRRAGGPAYRTGGHAAIAKRVRRVALGGPGGPRPQELMLKADGAVDELTAATLLRTIDSQRATLLATVAALSPEHQRWRAQPTAWSAVEVVEHLVLAEQVVLGDLNVTEGRIEYSSDASDRIRSILVWLVLRIGLRVTVPATTMLPSGTASLAALREQWDAQHQALRRFVGNLDGTGLRRRLFRHPIAGPLDALQALRLLSAHLRTHERQLKRLLAAMPVASRVP